ncbi:hypothetical protein Hanom_Chr00s001222g01676991 [Helianthus anomalus]
MGFHKFPDGSNKKLRTFLLTNHVLPRVLGCHHHVSLAPLSLILSAELVNYKYQF